eukprot:1386726-Amorphochlora_amoeboformis.AAC.2
MAEDVLRKRGESGTRDKAEEMTQPPSLDLAFDYWYERSIFDIRAKDKKMGWFFLLPFGWYCHWYMHVVPTEGRFALLIFIANHHSHNISLANAVVIARRLESKRT